MRITPDRLARIDVIRQVREADPNGGHFWACAVCSVQLQSGAKQELVWAAGDKHNRRGYAIGGKSDGWLKLIPGAAVKSIVFSGQPTSIRLPRGDQQ